LGGRTHNHVESLGGVKYRGGAQDNRQRKGDLKKMAQNPPPQKGGKGERKNADGRINYFISINVSVSCSGAIEGGRRGGKGRRPRTYATQNEGKRIGKPRTGPENCLGF